MPLHITQLTVLIAIAIVITVPQLLLDEPTNNFDLDGVRALQAALVQYQGAVVMTSHDMQFIQQVTRNGGRGGREE